MNSNMHKNHYCRILTVATIISILLPTNAHAFYYTKVKGNAIYSPEQNNTVKLVVPQKSTELSTLDTLSNSQYMPTLKAGMYNARGVKTSSTMGYGGTIAIGYSNPNMSASVEFSLDYDEYGTMKHEGMDVEWYEESAYVGTLSMLIPVDIGVTDVLPYIGVGIGRGHSEVDDESMHTDLQHSLLSHETQCSYSGAPTSDHNICPGYGNLMTSTEKSDTLTIISVIAGASLPIGMRMSLEGEYIGSTTFKRPRYNTTEGSFKSISKKRYKHKFAAGVKYIF